MWEQGTGKTKPVLDTATRLYDEGLIDALLVVAPNGVHRNWLTDEVPAHLPDRLIKSGRFMFWRTIKAKTKWHQRDFQPHTPCFPTRISSDLLLV